MSVCKPVFKARLKRLQEQRNQVSERSLLTALDGNTLKTQEDEEQAFGNPTVNEESCSKSCNKNEDGSKVCVDGGRDTPVVTVDESKDGMKQVRSTFNGELINPNEYHLEKKEGNVSRYEGDKSMNSLTLELADDNATDNKSSSHANVNIDSTSTSAHTTVNQDESESSVNSNQSGTPEALVPDADPTSDSKATEEVTNGIAVIEARVKPQQKTLPSSKAILEGLFGEKQFLEEQEYAADVSVSKYFCT